MPESHGLMCNTVNYCVMCNIEMSEEVKLEKQDNSQVMKGNENFKSWNYHFSSHLMFYK